MVVLIVFCTRMIKAEGLEKATTVSGGQGNLQSGPTSSIPTVCLQPPLDFGLVYLDQLKEGAASNWHTSRSNLTHLLYPYSLAKVPPWAK